MNFVSRWMLSAERMMASLQMEAADKQLVLTGGRLPMLTQPKFISKSLSRASFCQHAGMDSFFYL